MHVVLHVTYSVWTTPIRFVASERQIITIHVTIVKGMYIYRQILQFDLFRNDPAIKTYFTVIINVGCLFVFVILYL